MRMRMRIAGKGDDGLVLMAPEAGGILTAIGTSQSRPSADPPCGRGRCRLKSFRSPTGFLGRPRRDYL